MQILGRNELRPVVVSNIMDLMDLLGTALYHAETAGIFGTLPSAGVVKQLRSIPLKPAYRIACPLFGLYCSYVLQSAFRDNDRDLAIRLFQKRK
jgi:hypothetical protein